MSPGSGWLLERLIVSLTLFNVYTKNYPQCAPPALGATRLQGPFPRLQQALREPGEGADVGGGVPGPCGELRDGGAADSGRVRGGGPRARGTQDDVSEDGASGR